MVIGQVHLPDRQAGIREQANALGIDLSQIPGSELTWGTKTKQEVKKYSMQGRLPIVMLPQIVKSS